MNCPHCHKPAINEGTGPSEEGAYTLHFWRCKPCWAAWVVPEGANHALAPRATVLPFPVKDDPCGQVYGVLPDLPERPCRDCGSTRFWVPHEQAGDVWRCVICRPCQPGELQRVAEVETAKEREVRVKAEQLATAG